MSDKLLFHPKPYEDESLASYLNRLAIENSVPYFWIKSHVNIRINTDNHTINRIKDIETIKRIAHIANLKVEQVYNMTIHKYIFGSWYKNKEIKSQYPFNGFDSCSVKFCPLCLKENNYQRLSWMLALNKFCVKHNTTLIEKCTHCGYKVFSKNLTSGICYCRKYLAASKPEYCRISSIIKLQQYINSAYNISEKIKRPVLPFKCNDIEFLKLVLVLDKLINDNYGSIKFNNLIDDNTIKGRFHTYRYIYEIINDWSTKFGMFLDNYIGKYKFKIINQFMDLKFISKECWLSYKARFTSYYFIKNFEYNNSYRGRYSIHKWARLVFDIDLAKLLKINYKIKKTEKAYSQIEYLTAFFKKFIDKGDLLIDKDISNYVNLFEVKKEYFKNYDINTFYIFLHWLSLFSIDIKIDISHFGLKSIYIRKIEVNNFYKAIGYT